jgi:hypothetical protein
VISKLAEELKSHKLNCSCLSMKNIDTSKKRKKKKLPIKVSIGDLMPDSHCPTFSNSALKCI